MARGAGHTCALMRSGTVYARGCNLHQQCGVGMDSATFLGLPVRVAGLGGLRITCVAAGMSHTLACSDAGTGAHCLIPGARSSPNAMATSQDRFWHTCRRCLCLGLEQGRAARPRG